MRRLRAALFAGRYDTVPCGTMHSDGVHSIVLTWRCFCRLNARAVYALLLFRCLVLRARASFLQRLWHVANFSECGNVLVRA